MRESEFPFAKYRDWGETPKEVPDIDTNAILNLADWQSKVYKRPIRDDITGHYGFFPSHNGATGYVQRASERSFSGKTAESEGLSDDEFQDKKARQPIHIAENTESTIAVFWAVSQTRFSVLEEALNHVSKGRKIPTDQGVWAANAIADYGHCLQHPKDIDHMGVDHGKELGKVIKHIGGSAASDLEQFGLFAEVSPDVLNSYEGVSAMQVSLDEEQRRYDFWSVRHQAILDAYPDIRPSNEVLYMKIPLPELLSIKFVDTD